MHLQLHFYMLTGHLVGELLKPCNHWSLTVLKHMLQ